MTHAIRFHQTGGPDVLTWEEIEVYQTYALKDAAQAHRDLASRKTTGSTILLP